MPYSPPPSPDAFARLEARLARLEAQHARSDAEVNQLMALIGLVLAQGDRECGPALTEAWASYYGGAWVTAGEVLADCELGSPDVLALARVVPQSPERLGKLLEGLARRGPTAGLRVEAGALNRKKARLWRVVRLPGVDGNPGTVAGEPGTLR